MCAKKVEKPKIGQVPGLPPGATRASWELFIQTGMVVRLGIRNGSLFNDEETGGDGDGFQKSLRKVPSLVHLLPPRVTREDREEMVAIPFRRRHGVDTRHLPLALQVLSSADSVFPFIGKAVPMEGAAIMAALAAEYLLEGNSRPFQLRDVLRMLGSAPLWPEQVAKIESCCAQKGSLLVLRPPPDGISALDATPSLSRHGFERILAIKVPAEALLDRWDRVGRGRKKLFADDEVPSVVDLVTPTTTLADVVLPGDLKAELEMAAKIAISDKTNPPILAFFGPPGTGKTFAALAFAGSLNRKCAVFKLSECFQRYLGESEKQVQRAFREASKAGAILLIDEAEALLQDRSTAQTRWEICVSNVALKCLEAPAVPVILVSNFHMKLDDALHRRIHHLLDFPIPDASARRDIWARELEKSGIEIRFDLDDVAKIPLTGGLIKNASSQARHRLHLLGDQFEITSRNLMALATVETKKMGRLAGASRSCGFVAG